MELVFYFDAVICLVKDVEIKGGVGLYARTIVPENIQKIRIIIKEEKEDEDKEGTALTMMLVGHQ